MERRFRGYFASGSNHAGEIAGLAAIGCPVGVAVDEVNEAAIRELEGLAGTGIPTFIDSGAFGEFKADKEITDEEWRERLGTYERLARKLGRQAYCVAPDKVGDQEATLARLARYRWMVLKLRALGANIIVPIQRGALNMAEFAAEIEQVLGFGDWVRGIPLMRAATKYEELAAFAPTLKPGTKVHFLGKGVYAPDFERYRELVAHCELTCDSVRITALVGRKAGVKPLTAAQDRARVRFGYPVAPPTERQPKLKFEQTYRVKRDAIIEVMGPDLGNPELAARPEALEAAMAAAPREPEQLLLVA